MTNKFSRTIFTLILIISASCLSNAQEFLQHRSNFKLIDWKFYKGEITSAESGGSIDESYWQSVTVPHTWNAQDVLTDGPRYYQGVGWYRTTFDINRDDKYKRFFIRFEGVSLVSHVFINGNYLGTHKGGYSAFTYELTPFIKSGEKNYLSVKVDNSTQFDVAPSGTYLYPIFGGIYRPVTIFSTDDICISPLDYASSGVYIHPVKVSEKSAEVDVEVLLDYNFLPVAKTKSPELIPPAGMDGTGLYAEYFTNPNFEGKPFRTQVDDEISFDYEAKSPFDDMPANNFSIIWTGRFLPEKNGKYKFLLTSDDGSRLYLNGEKVIDNWGGHAAKEKSCEIFLEKGKEVSVKIEYNELGGEASIKFSWMTIDDEEKNQECIVGVTMLDKDGKEVVKNESNITLKNLSTSKSVQKIILDNPHLWDAKRVQYLYTLRVSLKDLSGKILDEIEQPLGLRFFEVDRDSGLILNGEPYSIHGVCRHQEWQGFGPALSDEQHQKDFEFIKEIGANGIRFAHYQQADIMYRLSDENGLVAWAEIPNTPAYRGNVPGYLQNCKEQLTELVKQNYNHPSILFWGLYNEIDIPIEDVKALNETVKRFDTNRLTTQADFVQVTDRHFVTDVTAWNWYFGWYYGNFEEYNPWYDKLHKEYPAIKGGLSEYGAEACITQQEENPKRPEPTGKYFPEQYQREYHEAVWKNIKDRKDIWCKFIWNMFDFSWTNVERGDKPFMNYKGLVTHDRTVKKDAFYFYKANWSDESVLHILSSRNSERKVANVPVEVYSNLNEVKLYVNGNFISKKMMDSDIHKIIWEGIELNPGSNHIEVFGYKDDQKITDACDWNYLK